MSVAERVVAPYAGAWIETPIHVTQTFKVSLVAPYAGAWIETSTILASRSTRGRSLRPVAPYAGAWIETCYFNRSRNAVRVAPYAGAWIETSMTRAQSIAEPCRPLRGGVD